LISTIEAGTDQPPALPDAMLVTEIIAEVPVLY
jgi:hypothetical protein